MYDDYFSSYRPSSVMSNVEHLTIVGDCKYDELLMKMTPNVKTLVFDGEDDELPDMNFTAIAKHLTKLETLKWEFHVESPDELLSSCELDAMITGFTDQFCKTLSIQLRNVDHLSARKIASYEKKRQYSSLVDLKGMEISIQPIFYRYRDGKLCYRIEATRYYVKHALLGFRRRLCRL